MKCYISPPTLTFYAKIMICSPIFVNICIWMHITSLIMEIVKIVLFFTTRGGGSTVFAVVAVFINFYQQDLYYWSIWWPNHNFLIKIPNNPSLIYQFIKKLKLELNPKGISCDLCLNGFGTYYYYILRICNPFFLTFSSNLICLQGQCGLLSANQMCLKFFLH